MSETETTQDLISHAILQITTLKESITEMIEKVEDLENTVDTLQSNVEKYCDFEGEIQQLEDNLEEMVDQAYQETNNLRSWTESRCDELENETHDVRCLAEDCEGRLDDFDNEIKDIQENLADITLLE
jgi:chromosome segregation ATPase